MDPSLAPVFECSTQLNVLSLLSRAIDAFNDAQHSATDGTDNARCLALHVILVYNTCASVNHNIEPTLSLTTAAHFRRVTLRYSISM